MGNASRYVINTKKIKIKKAYLLVVQISNVKTLNQVIFISILSQALCKSKKINKITETVNLESKITLNHILNSKLIKK